MSINIGEAFYRYLRSLEKCERFEYKGYDLCEVISPSNLYAVIINCKAGFLAITDFYDNNHLARREAIAWLELNG